MNKRIAILLMAFLALLVSSSIHRTKAAGPPQNNYATAFPATQNPISESGNWVNGPAPWAGMQTFGGHIGGTNTNAGCSNGSPDLCNDSHAALAGTWTANQAVCSTVFIGTVPRNNTNYEIENHLHQTITAGNSTGYEFNYSLNSTGNQYMQIVRWDGIVGGHISFASLAVTVTPASLPSISNGDTFCSSAIAGVLKSWLIHPGSGVIATSTANSPDTTYTGGAPGLGTFNASVAADNAQFGFSQFEATNVAAQTASQSDVLAVTNGALHHVVDNESVLIPPGTPTWTSGVTLPAGVGAQIFGYGIPDGNPTDRGASATCSATALTLAFTSSGSVFLFNQTTNPNASLTRVSCVAYNYSSGPVIAWSAAGGCNTTKCTNLRVDNTTYNNWTGHTSAGISYGIAVEGDMFGVIDHNTINGSGTTYMQFVEVAHPNFLTTNTSTGLYGDTSWAQPENYGSANALFMENNALTDAGCCENEGGVIDIPHRGGSRVVIRFNTFTINDHFNFTMGWHGTESGGRPRGGRDWEYYENTLNYPAGGCPGGGCASWIGVRSGTGLSWGQTINWSSPGQPPTVNFTTALIEGTTGSWPACDGIATKDGVDPAGVQYTGTVGAITTGLSGGTQDQITVSGASPGWATNQWSPNGAPYSFHDVTQSAAVGKGSQINSNTANTITVLSDGGPAAFHAAVNDQITIQRAFWCMDQSGGRGAGVNFNGNPSQTLSASNEVLSPAYFWMNNYAASVPAVPIVNTPNLRVIANRDYYIEATNQTAQTTATSPFNGTSGTGYGTKLRRPTTCTSGVSYWATDEGSWNTVSGGVQGNLYICGASGWPATPSYTPQNYPHFLVTGAAQPVGSVTIAPSSENFGSVTVGAFSSAQTATLTNTTTSAVTITSVTTGAPGANGADFPNSANTCTGAVPANGGSCQVTKQFSPTIVGAESATLTVATSVGSFPVSLSGTGVSSGTPSISIIPATLIFGNVVVNQSSQILVTVKNVGTANLVITGNNLAGGAGFNLNTGNCITTLAPNAQCTQIVVFNPLSTGNQTGTLTFTSNAPTSPNVLNLSGSGILVPTTATGVILQGVMIQ